MTPPHGFPKNRGGNRHGLKTVTAMATPSPGPLVGGTVRTKQTLGAGMVDTANRQAGDPGAVAAVVGPVWSEAKVCQALGLTTDALAALRAAGEVLWAITSDGVTVYPVAQFQRRDGVIEVRPGLVPLLRALRGFDGWTAAVLLCTPAPELDGQTPLDWLRDGADPGTVATLGLAVAQEWSAG